MLRLFDSLMRNYPIQTFLFWRTKDEIKARKFMEQIDWDSDLSDYYDPNITNGGMEKVFVLDGQQRLQTLYAIFRGAVLSENRSSNNAFFDVVGKLICQSVKLLPANYFARLKFSGVDIGKHLLLEDVSSDPSKLQFDTNSYRDFRDRRLDAIWQLARAMVNPEGPGVA